MKNKLFIPATLITILLATFFFLFYSYKLERQFKNPIKLMLGNSAADINKIDTLNIIKINESALNFRFTNPQKTISLANDALKLSKSANYVRGIGESFRVKGIGYYYLSDNEKAIRNYLEALKQFTSINDLNKQARVYNNIGRLYGAYDPYKSLDYYTKSLKIASKLGDQELNSGLCFNIANILQSQSKFKQALLYYNRSNKIFESRKDTINMIINYLFTGTVYHQLKNYKEAEWRIKKAIEGAKTKKLYPTLVDSYTCLSKIYIEQGRFYEAEINIQKGFKYSEINENKGFSYNLLHAAYQLEGARNNFKNALKYLVQIHKYDSLQLSKNQIDNLGKTTRNHLQEQKIRENEVIIERASQIETLFWWTITIIHLLILFTFLIGMGTYFVLRKIRRRKDIEIENRITMLEQKTLQGMMNPHFIFNVLNTIQYFINQDDSKEANRILTLFARLMRKHLEICLKSSITLEEEIEYLSLYLSIEKIRFAEKMDYEVNISENINPEEIILPPLLIQPFVENAIWHGIIPKESKGLVNLNFNFQNNQLEIKIIDDGVGTKNSKSNKSSNHISRGLELIQERVKLLNKLSNKKIVISNIETVKIGTQISIIIPI
ncbi:histidine kinase [Daejeonella sp.]|uniref:tetratricopeptide repeat-containing sensor histidine kinase n=1 Tax=Daejeonella sp. TaxID=2805397 RepID=UPI0025BF276F|nr:histidine kinase [Daejeonella sp.]